MNVVALALNLIDVGDRLRAVDEDYARVIAASMQQDGQRTPVEVRAPDDAGRYRLIAGGHRLRAAAIAGLDEVQAVVMAVGELEAQRLEIEENLCRHELSELDRSTFLARWKEVYEALHEAAQQGRWRSKGKVAMPGHLATAGIERFTAVASERTGLSERTIRRATKRYSGIVPDVRARIAGTWLAGHGGELDFLARLTPAVQRQVIDLMQQRGATALKPLRDQVLGIRMPVPDPDQAQCDALVKLWRRTGSAAKRAFAAELAKDGPWTLTEDA